MDDRSESGAPHHNIILTPDEKRVFGQLFTAATVDTENRSVVTGEVAVKFFEKSGLNPRILGEIWGIADTDNQGYLDHIGFSVALRLIGQAQNGQHPRPELAQRPGPLPKFDGLNIQYPPRTVPPTTSSPPPGNVPQPTGAVVRVPPLTEADVEKFSGLFQHSGAIDGILPGEKAKEIFQKARLPNVTLGLIWNLADRQQRGALNCAEFVVAMHLINCSKNGTLPALPQILPPGLYEVASGKAPAARGPPTVRPPPGAGPGPRFGPGVPNVPQIPKQMSGPRAQSPLSRQFTPPVPIQAQVSGDWAVTPREKQEFDALYAQVDRANKGFITGEEAVPFFSNSKLPEDVLANIWDLADIHKAGRLTRDEFAIAMHLIRQQRSRQASGLGLPETLPPNLIPPSMRGGLAGAAGLSAPPTSVFDGPSPAPPKPSQDLFGLDPFGGSGSAQMTPSGTGASTGRPPQPMQVQGMFGGPIPGQPSNSPFVNQGPFGGMQSNPGQPQQPKQPNFEDLLGDSDDQTNKAYNPETTDVANLNNSVNTLQKQTQDLAIRKVAGEADLTSLQNQKKELELRLAQLRSLFERETAENQRIQEQLQASRAETNRLRNDYAVIEASYRDLATKKQEAQTQLEADQRENAQLKERMRHLNAENINLRQQVEKLKTDARQQKGLTTISKKQVQTAEQERDKLKQEIEDLKAPSTPAPASPTLSQASQGTNPFMGGYRRPQTANESNYNPSSPFAQSPQPQHHQQTTIEDVFGPSFATHRASPAPPTSFHTAKTDSISAPPEGVNQEFSTPPTSPPASSYHNSPHPTGEIPPQSASQITSAFLPLNVQRTESVTSSTQNNAPTSVPGGSVSSRPETPTNWMASSQSDARERDPFAPRDPLGSLQKARRTSMSVKSDAGTESSNRASMGRQDDPFGSAKLEKSSTGDRKRDSFPNIAHQQSGLQNAWPSEPLRPTGTGESTTSKMSTSSKPTMIEPSLGRQDPFNLGRAEVKGPVGKEAFDNAFASFGLKAKLTGDSSLSADRVNKEFPPLEVFQGDESDSDAGGFDDNFTSQSPQQTRTAPATSPAPPTTNAPPFPETFAAPRSQQNTGTSLPPPANAQSPPPAYGQAADKNPFPQEFSGLLPSRSDPFSHEGATPGGSSNVVASPGTASGRTGGSIFGNSPTSKAATPAVNAGSNLFPSAQNTGSNIFSAQPAAPKQETKQSADDDFDDDAFADLADAKEDDKDNDNDFNIVDKPGDAFDFESVFEATPQTTGQSHHTGLSDDFDFGFKIADQKTAPVQQPAMSGSSQAAPPSQDWDAIFSGLQNPIQQQPSGTTTEQPKELQPSALEGSTLTKAQTNGSNSAVAFENNNANNNTNAGENKSAAQSGTGPTASAEQKGALKPEEEDKLTELIGMGFSRDDSLKALEKHQFDLAQATNFLLDN